VRVEIFGNGFEVPDVLRTYAEARVWLAVQRAAERLSWVGVRLMSVDAGGVVGGGGGPNGGVAAARRRLTCQLDVWLRGIGLITVRHTDANAYVGIDCAAVRLEQAIVRRVRERGWHAARSIGGGVPEGGGEAFGRGRGVAGSPRCAVLIVPRDLKPRLSLIPWLRARYGIERVQTLCLARPEWDALAAGEARSLYLERLKDHLALAQLGRPEAIVVVGGAAPRASSCARSHGRREVERALSHLRSWDLPAEVIGAWVTEHWDAEQCLIESEELPLRPDETAVFQADEGEEMYVGLTSD
jgi:hypothetical protein